MKFARLILAIWLSANAMSNANAQSPRSTSPLDRVWLEPKRPTQSQSDWYPQAIEQLEGRIVEFDDKQLSIAEGQTKDKTIVAARRVLWIEPGEVSDGEPRVIDAFENGDNRAVLADLAEVLKARPPVWRQQWLTMLGANSAKLSGRAKISLELVSQLDRRPLPAMVVAWAPIAWTPERSNDPTIQSSLARLQDPSPLTQLVAASWLLSSSHRNDALETIQTLATNEDRPSVMTLARCLLWTTASPPEVKANYQQWLDELETIPISLSVGPTVSLQRKLQAAGLSQAANALEWSLELTPVHPHPALMTNRVSP
ncbi:hypothetical protein N9N28_00720 [Rubripirellula amarantea]|nr:hypothetical protein [Rubripirellula amarantea]